MPPHFQLDDTSSDLDDTLYLDTQDLLTVVISPDGVRFYPRTLVDQPLLHLPIDLGELHHLTLEPDRLTLRVAGPGTLTLTHHHGSYTLTLHRHGEDAQTHTIPRDQLDAAYATAQHHTLAGPLTPT